MRGRAVYATLMKFVIISNETGNLRRVAHKNHKHEQNIHRPNTYRTYFMYLFTELYVYYLCKCSFVQYIVHEHF